MGLRRAGTLYFTLYLALMMTLVAPAALHTRTAQAEVGVKTVLLGGLVGAGALLAAVSMAGPAKVMASAGTAGTGFGAILGRALGAMWSGVNAVALGLKTAAMTVASAIGSAASGAASAAGALLSNPWFLGGAAIIGGGLLAYHFYKKNQRAKTAAEDYEQSRGWGLLDRVRQRMMAPFGLTPGAVVVPAGVYDPRFASGMARFYQPGPRPFGTGDPRDLNGFGLSADTAPTDQSGQPQPVDATVRTMELRQTLQPRRDSAASAIGGSTLEEQLERALRARSAAYEKLLVNLKDGDSRGSSIGGTESSMNDASVKGAISEYKQAHQLVQQLRTQLGR